MKKAISITLTFLLFGATAYAQEPAPGNKDRFFWTLAAGAQAATIYDVNTTLGTLTRCPTCYEANPIMKPFARNSVAAYGAGMSLSAASIWGSKKLKEKGSRWWWAPLVGQIGLHTALGIRNSQI